MSLWSVLSTIETGSYRLHANKKAGQFASCDAFSLDLEAQEVLVAVELCQTSLRVSWDNVFVHQRSLRQDIPGDEMRGCSTSDVACLPYKLVRTTPGGAAVSYVIFGLMTVCLLAEICQRLQHLMTHGFRTTTTSGGSSKLEVSHQDSMLS